MTVLIVASMTDPAAMNIAKILVKNFGFREQTIGGERVAYKRDNILLAHIETDILGLCELDVGSGIESAICISRHSSESGKPTLTTHVPGNPGPAAELGGTPRTMAWADPYRLKSALIELSESSSRLGLEEYSVSLEATHHGPTELRIPVLFVEIGSTREQWLSPRAGEAAAAAAFKAAMEPRESRSAVGFGGGHYSPKHTTAVINRDFAIGHILPEYFFEYYDPQIVEQAFRKTTGGCETAVIDWKGLKSNGRKRLISKLEEMGVEKVRV